MRYVELVDTKAFSGMLILVVNYRTSGLLKRSGLEELSRHGALVLIVDNYYSDEERETVRAVCLHFGWSFYPNVDNSGFGAGCNIGLRTARELGLDWVLLLNPDASIDSSSLLTVLRCAERSDVPALVSPIIYREDGLVWFSGGWMRPVWKQPSHAIGAAPAIKPDWLTAACLLIPLKDGAFSQYFSDDYFLYWEDIDFSFRWIQLGGALIVTQSQAIHKVGGSQGGEKSLAYVRYNMRNRLVFAAKFLSIKDLVLCLLWTPIHVVALMRGYGLRRRWRTTLPFMRAILAGSLSGLSFTVGNCRRKLLNAS